MAKQENPLIREYPIKVMQKRSKVDPVHRSSSSQTIRPMSSRHRMRNISSRDTVRYVASRDTVRNVAARDTVRLKPGNENGGSPARRSQPTTPRHTSVAVDVMPRTPVVNRIGTQPRATPHANNQDGVRPAPPPFLYGPGATPQEPPSVMPQWTYPNHFGGSPFNPYYPQYIATQHGYMYAVPSSPSMLGAPPPTLADSSSANNSSAEDTENSEDTEDHTPTRAGPKNNRRAA